MKNPSELDIPAVSVQDIQRMLSGELSLRSRMLYTALLLVAFASSAVIALLWMTEPALPLRTRIAFAVLVAIGLSWVAYAAWVLTMRRVLFAGHRVIAARMAIAFSAVFGLGSVALAVWTTVGRTAVAAAGVGLFMLVISVGVLFQARRQFARLLEQRRVLELAERERS